jgi:hypothetical protein
MPAMAAVPRPPFDGVDCEVLLVLGWLVAVVDDVVVYSLLVVVVLEDNVFVATEAVAAAWPSWVTYIRTTVLAIYCLVDHDWQGNGTTYRTCQD